MIRKPGKPVVAKDLVELRREAVATLRRFSKIVERLNLYDQYLALSKTYDVQMAGPFLVIQGGNPGPTIRTKIQASNFRGRPVKKKILIVEDNKDSSEILRLFITKIGHHAIKAKNSKEGITLAEAEEPDLIFIDVALPKVDGIQTTAMLRQNPKTSHIPVVALTAWISALWQEKAAKVGIVTYLTKPISLQTLKETIEEYTNGSLTRNSVTPKM
jgi:two-component system cell cycle response regulator DivK